MPLADVYAIHFAGPLFLTALSGPMLGEPVGWRRWSAVAVGFLGVVVMIQPGTGVFSAVALDPAARRRVLRLRHDLRAKAQPDRDQRRDRLLLHPDGD